MNHCLILDIGKTNKKAFVFDEDYRIVLERSDTLPETIDEDGFPCEDLYVLKKWVIDTLLEILEIGSFEIKAVNVSAYGASFVHLDKKGEPLTPLYNYLKPFPDELKKSFFETYGGQLKITLETASPDLGNLNSGLQLYWLKHHNPLIFNKIEWSLHLPQYISSIIHDGYYSEITSIGCHTMIWDFHKNTYHDWVINENMVSKYPPIRSIINPQKVHIPISVGGEYQDYFCGMGLHDSSAALIPYFTFSNSPFVLISTGTWCISMNPFNDEPLTEAELEQDCLCYLTYEGRPVKASRFFGGKEHEDAVKSIANDFGVAADFFTKLDSLGNPKLTEAYHNLMCQLVDKQVVALKLVLTKNVSKIFVDGGFSKNEIFMTLLAKSFPDLEVFAATIAQATALGAAMAIHQSWNEKPYPDDLIKVKRY